jgi:biotin carboxyl carrier protein
MRSHWRDGEHTRTVELKAEGSGHFQVIVDGVPLAVHAELLPRGDLRLITDQGVVVAEITAVGAWRFVHFNGMDFVLEKESAARRTRGGGAQGGSLEAPMPGVVVRVMVAVGDEVQAGQPLVAIEAMKMEHVLRAPRAGRVKSVTARTGEMVHPGVPLAELE